MLNECDIKEIFMYKYKFKSVRHAIGEISKWETTTWRGTIKTPAGDDLTSILKDTANGGYVLSILKRQLKRMEPAGMNMHFKHHDNAFVIDEFFEKSRREVIKRNISRGYTVWKYLIDSFSNNTEAPEEPLYLRMVIPISDKFKVHYIFNSDIIKTDVRGSFRGLINISLLSQTFHVYSLEDNGRHFLFIDSVERIKIDEFDEICWTINISLAFFNGQLWQQRQYLFGYENIEMAKPSRVQYKSLRPNLLSVYAATTNNPSSWMRDKDKNDITLKFLSDKALQVTPQVLSKLCSWIHSRDEHKISVLLIVEAKCASLLMMPAGFAIALEGLATIFEELFSDKTAPIKDKKKARLLIEKMNAVISEFEDDKSFDIEVLKKKISAINSPTNRDRLKIPFQLLNIPLTKDDDLALDYRNYLLHGNVGLLQKEKKKIVMEETELGMRLLTLANAIILKLIGYKGWMVNHVKAQEFGKVIDEPYLRDIGDYENIDLGVRRILPF